MDKIEDQSICRECGGFCCKKCGCDYFVSDLESMKIETIENLLMDGRTSIVAALQFGRLNNGKITCSPILYLRARNINRSEIDLLSFKTTCASLEANGCYYDLEHRPSGGASLIPMRNDKCYSNVDREEELKKWLPYQNILQRIVKRHTGMSVNSKLKEDAEELFYNILTKNFDGVSKLELMDVLNMMPMLTETYNEEYTKSKQRASNYPILIKTKK